MAPEVLDVGKLCRQAEQQTGLSSWGDRHFVEPLQIYLDSLTKTAKLHANGWKATTADIKRILANRLLIQQELERKPHIKQRPVPDPLFIIGMPRTGSTMLHNLLACDPSARSLRYYESYTPVASRKAKPGADDPRIRIAALQLRVMNRLAPGLQKIHAVYPTSPEECSRLMEHAFVDTLFELRNWIPDYSAWLRKNESDSIYYEEFRTMLQLLDIAEDQTHWVCKSPRHLPSLETLVEVFPDVKFVWTNRDPVQTVPSVASLSAEACGLGSDQVDKTKIGSFWLERISTGLQRGRLHRKSDDPQRYVDVEYEELVADPISVVRQIYATHDYIYSDVFESNMMLWLDENRQNKYGKHSYSPEDFGLSAEEIRERFEP